MLFTLISQSPGKSPGKRLKEPEVPEAQIIPRTFLTGLESKKKKKKKRLIFASSMVLKGSGNETVSMFSD